MDLSSTAISTGEPMPRQFTCDGANVSPPLRWSEPPKPTKSFALICEDPDAPRGTFTHWVVYNIPAEFRYLDEGDPMIHDAAIQVNNDFGNARYDGPAPPKGKPHRYYFRLFALDSELAPKAIANREQLLNAMEGHVLAKAVTMATYQRQ